MCLGRDLAKSVFDEIGTGYEGTTVMKEGKEYEINGNHS